jgi:hypothetical protein
LICTISKVDKEIGRQVAALFTCLPVLLIYLANHGNRDYSIAPPAFVKRFLSNPFSTNLPSHRKRAAPAKGSAKKRSGNAAHARVWVMDLS